jgi:beta-lactamase regulating signal transducer with metallopeptidase domain
LIIVNLENNIMALVGAFIGIAILLGIGTQILGSTVQNCSNLSDYDATAGATQTGWALACEDQNTQTQNAYSLLMIVLIVIAAVVILSVVKML